MRTAWHATDAREGELINSGRDAAQIVIASQQILDREERSEPTVVLEIDSNITERKQLRGGVAAGSAYNRRLLEASLDPLVTIGPDGKITDVNEATEAATGYPEPSLSARTSPTTSPSPGGPGGLPAGLPRGAGPRLSPGDPAPGRRVTPVVYNASVYRDEAGQVIGVFAAARDITAQKRAEEKFARCRTSSTWPPTPSSSAAGTVPSDPGTGALSKCTAGVVRRPWVISLTILATRFPVSLAELEDRLARDGSWEGELIHSRRDGARIVVASRHVLDREERGEPTVILEMNSGSRSEGADDELGDSRVSWRNASSRRLNWRPPTRSWRVSPIPSPTTCCPLRAIDGFCRDPCDGTCPRPGREPRRYLQRVSENTRKMGRLIDELLHFSRLGRQAMTRQPVAMADLVRQCLEELRGEARVGRSRSSSASCPPAGPTRPSSSRSGSTCWPTP